MINQHYDVLLHFAAQNPLDYFHGFFIGHAHALNKGARLTNLFQRFINLRPAAMHYDWIHANELKQDNVARKTFFQPLFHHGVPAVLNHDGLAVVLTDIRQRFCQYFRFQ